MQGYAEEASEGSPNSVCVCGGGKSRETRGTIDPTVPDTSPLARAAAGLARPGLTSGPSGQRACAERAAAAQRAARWESLSELWAGPSGSPRIPSPQCS